MLSSSASADRSYQLIAGHPALDLVNTLDWRFRDTGSEELLNSYDDLLRFCAQAGLLTEDQAGHLANAADEKSRAASLAACRDLRESAVGILYAMVDGQRPEVSHIDTIERLFQEGRRHQHLAWAGTRFEWVWDSAQDHPALPVWMLAASTAGLLLSEDLVRLRACEKSDCRWLFLDTSKNHTRRWCDMKICGNRMKARRFKALHRA